jgi:hypothetical protein
MQRRTFMKSALAVPLLGIPASPAAVIGAVPAEREGKVQELLKELADQEDNLERIFQEVKKHGVTMAQLRALDKANRAKLSPLDLDLELKRIKSFIILK